MEKKHWKKKAAVGVICAATGAGVLVNGAIDSPIELLQDNASAAAVTAQADDGMTAQEDVRKNAPLRRRLLALPLGVRALFVIPLWALGWGVTELAALLWQAVLTPIGGSVASWLLTAVLAVGAFALTAKAMCPDLPLKKLLRPRNILIIAGGVLCLGLIDTLLPLFWEDYPPIGQWLRLIAAALMIAAGCLSLRKLHHKKEKTVPLTTKQQAMALADTVCPPRNP